MIHLARCWSFHPKLLVRLPALLAALTIPLAAATRTWATGGPENVLLVVNSRSLDSLCIANHYAALRHIPPSNFLFLPWDPQQENTDVDTFREKILLPVLRVAKLRIPGRQIDYVVYSSDFPWGIQIGEDIKKFQALMEKQEKEKKEKEKGDKGKEAKKPAADHGYMVPAPAWTTFLTPLASINGLTYLWEPVLNANKGAFYVDLESNWYGRTWVPEQAKEPTLGFSAATFYGPHGEAGSGPGRRYLLSMMLGVTRGRGNTRAEVLSYLDRSAAADGTHPRGTIYFVQNGDVRSRVRQAGFPQAVKELKALGVAAEIIEGTLPEKKNDVQGAMLGTAAFDWKASQSTILPGAICEHFTSFGGDLRATAGQTPLSELLRYGAAAASGTVTEPYAISNKFPAPMLQVHYARGCTVAESFYQSVLCPYQLLIVGDPLCRPWANIPEITATGVADGETVSSDIRLWPRARFAVDHGSTVPAEVDHFEMILDGLKIHDCPPAGSLSVDTAIMADGAHELRVVAVGKGPLPARGEKIIPFASSNHRRTISATCKPDKVVSLQRSLVITVRSPQSTSIKVVQGTRELGAIAGDSGQVEIQARTLGPGPVRLQVVGVGDGEPKSSVFAPPLDIVVEE